MDKLESALKIVGWTTAFAGSVIVSVSAVMVFLLFVVPSIGMFFVSSFSGTGITGFAVLDAGALLTTTNYSTYYTASIMFVWMLLGLVLMTMGNSIIPARRY